MRIQVVTIFPELFETFLTTSLLGRAIVERSLEVTVHDLRIFAENRHSTVDDEPYGGGGGMVMKVEPWLRAVRELGRDSKPHRILLSPQGVRFTDGKARELARQEHLILLCGRYEGIDERVRQTVVDEELSIGDYVLSGGELPAMVVIEALSRQIPGVVGRADSVEKDSFRDGLLDYPHYTRPQEFQGLRVPEVLLSGDHEAIRLWRVRQALLATLEKRPEMLDRAELSVEQRRELEALLAEAESKEVGQMKLVNRGTDKDNK